MSKACGVLQMLKLCSQKKLQRNGAEQFYDKGYIHDLFFVTLLILLAK